MHELRGVTKRPYQPNRNWELEAIKHGVEVIHESARNED